MSDQKRAVEPAAPTWQVSGNPTAAELAAVTAVLAARATSGGVDIPPQGTPHNAPNSAGDGWVGHWRRTAMTPPPSSWQPGIFVSR